MFYIYFVVLNPLAALNNSVRPSLRYHTLKHAQISSICAFRYNCHRYSYVYMYKWRITVSNKDK